MRLGRWLRIPSTRQRAPLSPTLATRQTWPLSVIKAKSMGKLGSPGAPATCQEFNRNVLARRNKTSPPSPRSAGQGCCKGYGGFRSDQAPGKKNAPSQNLCQKWKRNLFRIQILLMGNGIQRPHVSTRSVHCYWGEKTMFSRYFWSVGNVCVCVCARTRTLLWTVYLGTPLENAFTGIFSVLDKRLIWCRKHIGIKLDFPRVGRGQC